ncbi:MAG TPA: 1-deoxy-D-xylulose-5-phosphate reductoisomerase [Planctomycetota bacterium]|nr:1-deoxy-D-xylulose-5-phosphate reductoisomerase [Planctomycetota bacterium]
MKNLCILGCTGSIGVSTLRVVAQFPDKFRVRSMTAGSNIRQLAEQVHAVKPDRVAIADKEKIPEFKALLNGWKGEILGGVDGLVELAEEKQSDYVVTAIVGAAGLVPTLAALKKGKQVGIANKEPLVMAGPLMLAAAKSSGSTILPIDSEHSAVFQSARAGAEKEIRKIILTASGGPFRTATKEMMLKATKESALKHPTWSMGAKITIDSATLMNKALEIIEAHFLFNVPYEAIEVWVHPQSIVHALVEFSDSSVVAQLGLPDMRLPIQYALTYPERLDGALPPLPLDKMASLTFEAPDRQRFPTLDFAYDAGKRGGTAPAVLNAANEQAVALFLDGRITFCGIFDLVGKALASHKVQPVEKLETVLEADAWARRFVRETCQ